eukprot:1160089-Pelagomonas_calceolata.AAC.7
MSEALQVVANRLTSGEPTTLRISATGAGFTVLDPELEQGRRTVMGLLVCSSPALAEQDAVDRRLGFMRHYHGAIFLTLFHLQQCGDACRGGVVKTWWGGSSSSTSGEQEEDGSEAEIRRQVMEAVGMGDEGEASRGGPKSEGSNQQRLQDAGSIPIRRLAVSQSGLSCGACGACGITVGVQERRGCAKLALEVASACLAWALPFWRWTGDITGLKTVPLECLEPFP